jgi:hypothetical protein
MEAFYLDIKKTAAGSGIETGNTERGAALEGHYDGGTKQPVRRN